MPRTLTSAAPPAIRPKSLSEEIAEVLQRYILTGILPPGRRLVERELIGQFGVSSIPIREALQELESRGLVVRRHNYGCSVVQLTAEDVERICEFRRVLEPKMIEWAAERITPERARELEEQMERLAAAAEGDDVSAFFHEDLVLHRMIWETSGNRFAARALETALGSLFASGLAGARGGQIDLRREVRKHRRLLKALRSGDARKAAEDLMDIAEGFENVVAEAG